jgi:hypothetical protein
MMMVLVLLIGLLAATAWTAAFGFGALLVWRGLRGRLVDHDPRCRRCGYNLIASPQRPARCPECGATIYGLGTIRLGARRRRDSLVIIGAAIMIMCIGPIGLALIPSAVATAPAPRPAAIPAPRIAPAAQGPLLSLQEDLPGPVEPIEPHSHAPARQGEAPGAPVEGEAATAAERGDDSPWHTLRTINGCCPHCSCPVGPMSRSPFCPECGRNIAE